MLFSPFLILPSLQLSAFASSASQALTRFYLSASLQQLTQMTVCFLPDLRRRFSKDDICQVHCLLDNKYLSETHEVCFGHFFYFQPSDCTLGVMKHHVQSFAAHSIQCCSMNLTAHTSFFSFTSYFFFQCHYSCSHHSQDPGAFLVKISQS